MNSISKAVFVTALVLSILATLAITGRFYCRLAKKARLSWDDWLAAAAWALAFAYSVTAEWGVFHAGVGLLESQLTPDIAVKYLKIDFLVEMLLVPASGFIKLSALAFYRRVFAQRPFITIVDCIIAITSAWTLAFFLGFLLNLIPVSLEWSTAPERPDRLNVPVFIICYSVIGFLLDLVIVILPIPMLIRLRTSKNRKAKYYGFFLLWTFCCVAALIKLTYAVKWWQWNHQVGLAKVGDEISVVTTRLQMWFLIESNVAVTAACLPMLGPLYLKCKALPAMMRRASLLSPGRSSTQWSTEMSEAHINRSNESVATASPENRKWTAVWRAIAGGNTVTSVGPGSEGPPSRPDDNRAGIHVEQRFGTEVHHAGVATSSKSSEKAALDDPFGRQV